MLLALHTLDRLEGQGRVVPGQQIVHYDWLQLRAGLPREGLEGKKERRPGSTCTRGIRQTLAGQRDQPPAGACPEPEATAGSALTYSRELPPLPPPARRRRSRSPLSARSGRRTTQSPLPTHASTSSIASADDADAMMTDDPGDVPDSKLKPLPCTSRCRSQ